MQEKSVLYPKGGVLPYVFVQDINTHKLELYSLQIGMIFQKNIWNTIGVGVLVSAVKNTYTFKAARLVISIFNQAPRLKAKK